MNKPGVDSDQSSGKAKQYSIPQLLSLNKDGVRSKRLYQVPHDQDDDNQHLNNNGGDVSQQSSGSQFSQSYHHRQQQQQQQFQPPQVGAGRMPGGPPGLKKLPPGFSAAPPGIPAPAQRHFRQKTAPQAGESSANQWLSQQHQQQRDGDNDGYGLQQDQHRQKQQLQQQQPDVFDMEKFKAEMRKMSGLPAAPQSSYSDDTPQQQQLGTQYPLQDQAIQFNHDDYVNSVEDVIFQSDLLELPADEADGEQVGNSAAPEQGLRQSRFGGRFFNLDASVTTDTTSSAQSSSSVNQQQQFAEDQGLQTSSQPASAGKRTPPPSLSSAKRKGSSSTSSINVPTSVLKRLGTATSSLQSSPQPSSPLKSVGKKQKKKQQQELQQKESVLGQQVDASSKTVTQLDGKMKAKAGKQQDSNNAAVKQPPRKQAYANEGTRYVQKDFVIKDLQLAQELDVNSNFVVQMPPPLPLMPVIPGLPSPTASPLIVDGQPVLPPPLHILALLIYQSGQPVPEPLLQFLQPPFILPEQLLQFRPSLPVSPIAMNGAVGLQQQQQQQQLPLQKQSNAGDSSPTFGQQQPNSESTNPLQKWFGNVSGKLQNAPVNARASKEVLHVEDIEQQQQHL
ncbi:hypothetical protein MP228_000900 [Amoeboaphelidium protococcarum]|nr:hypothetical protein MP228_000900 [Amoeboaphelidium protococcarum]